MMRDEVFAEHGIAFRTNGVDPSRQTLVFIHGLSSSASAWLSYEEVFEDRFNVVTFDLRGHGKSRKPRGRASYTIAAMADDLRALLAHIGLKSIVIIGHSFGALVALEFLANHQSLVTGAVLLSPDYRIGRRLPEKILHAALRISPVLDIFPFSSTPGSRVDYTRYLGTRDWNLGRLSADVANTGLRVYIFCTQQSYGFDREAFLSQITVPVLLIHGKDDTIFPAANSSYMAARIPGARLILLDDADHIVVLNNFSQLSSAIAAFVEARRD